MMTPRRGQHLTPLSNRPNLSPAVAALVGRRTPTGIILIQSRPSLGPAVPEISLDRTKIQNAVLSVRMRDLMARHSSLKPVRFVKRAQLWHARECIWRRDHRVARGLEVATAGDKFGRLLSGVRSAGLFITGCTPHPCVAPRSARRPVSYTHLTLPTILLV